MGSYAISGTGDGRIDIYFSGRAIQDQRHMVIHSAVRIFFMSILNCRFMLMCNFNSTLQSVPCQSNNM